MNMTTPKISASNEVVRKSRLKRRLLRSLTSSFRKKNPLSTTAKTKGGDSMTDSEDSDTEVRISDFRKEVFCAKRNIDESLEGKALRFGPQSPKTRLLPPADAEIESVDDYLFGGRFLKRQDSNSTLNSIKTHDSLVSRLADTSNNNNNNTNTSVVIEELSLITTSADDRVMVFTDESSASVLKAKSHKQLTVRFADDHGGALELVHWTITMYSEEENDWARAIVLLLSPKKKKFEFLHVSYNLYDKTSVMDVLNQLPQIATDDALKEQKYVGLLRKEGGRELINTVSIQSYYLKKNEILVAVVDGHYGKGMLRMALPLLENRKIMKAVTRVRSKKVNIKQLKPLTKKNKSCSSSSSDKVRVYPMDDLDSHHTDESRTRFGSPDRGADPNCSFNESVPDMDEVFLEPQRRSEYLVDDANKDKVTLTRFVNAGILTAVVCGVQRKFRGKGKQEESSRAR